MKTIGKLFVRFFSILFTIIVGALLMLLPYFISHKVIEYIENKVYD